MILPIYFFVTLRM
uniref:Uncharacterized protein n=1 Tax=Anguilla anguilla TaxID=7936 RepID=A0A0E9RNK9_ANGAN